MDYLYHYWDPRGHSYTGHCACTCLTCFYKLDLLLLLIVIYLLLVDKITININTSASRLPSVQVNNINSTTRSSSMPQLVTSTTETNSLLSSSVSSNYSKVRTSSIINHPSPWESMVVTDRSSLANNLLSERSTPIDDPPESLPESVNSFVSSSSIRRRLIKPDISLDFLDSSSSSAESSDNDEAEDRFTKDDSNDDSLEECNVFSGCANDEHFYRDTLLSEETFTNEIINVKRLSLVPNSIY